MTAAPPRPAVPRPAAVQLYSLREAAAADFPAVLSQVASMGYAGVEPAGLHGHPAPAVRRLLADLGLRVASSHGPMPDTDEGRASLEEQAEIGSPTCFVSLGADWFSSPERLERAADAFAAGTEAAHAMGMTLGYHNHWWELEGELGGRKAYDAWLDALAERDLASAPLEVDLYWARVAGEDLVALLGRLGSRVTHLHVKDGPATHEDPMVAVGSGTLDIPAALGASPHVLWHIVELDRCATDMAGAVGASLAYLVGAGLSSGRPGAGQPGGAEATVPA